MQIERVSPFEADKYLRATATKRILRHREIDENGCWLWTADIVNSGYGRVKFKYEHWFVHRLSFAIFKPSEFDKYRLVLHLCDVKRCFNPGHLYIGTRIDNVRDAMERGQLVYKKAAYCSRAHEYTPENTYTSPSGERRCIQCEKIRYAIRRAKV